MTSDLELVQRSRRKDADAFGVLVTRHQQLVFGVALARCHDPALAEDVAQEAFVTAWRDLERLRDVDRVGPWVAGIARNLAANAVRTRARRDQAPLPVANDDVPSAEAAALEREDRELLQRALSEIPEDYRETLVLHYFESQSVAEIADALAVTEDVVKQRLSRGRRALRDNVATRVETVLARTRLRPAFRAGVVAALATTGARKAAAGKVVMLVTAKKLVLAIAAIVAVVGGALYLKTRSTGTAAGPTVGIPAPEVTPMPNAGAPAATAPPPKINLHVERLADKAARERLLAQISAARERRAPSSTPTATPAPTLPGGDLDKQYIRAAVRELIPLITECYEQGLLKNPKLAGDVVVEFTIEGEQGVGGVISTSAVDKAATTLADPSVGECIQETMYALEIDPPANGGSVKVRYPFAFRPAGPDDAPPSPAR